MPIKRITPIFTLLLLLPFWTQAAKANDFPTWLQQFQSQAIKAGVSQQTLTLAFNNITPDPRVIELDQKQPERVKMGFATYLRNVMSQNRIDVGRRKFAENKQGLMAASNAYGVPPEIMTALWGVETSYGANTGGFDIIRSLATLAWEGRRAAFFQNELMQALFILQGGHVSRENFKGSWAGAMGQNQFMPSSWAKFAADGNGDGHKDIWTSKADVFSSTANYLSKSGWDPRVKWGYAVTLPDNYHPQHHRKSFNEWVKEGVRFRDTPPSLESHTILELIVPDGGEGRAYLVTQNFGVIMTWNKSTYFALTVGLLSDLIAHGPKTSQQLHMNP